MADEGEKVGLLSSDQDEKSESKVNDAQVDAIDKMTNKLANITIEGDRDFIVKPHFVLSKISDDMLYKEGVTKKKDDYSFFAKLDFYDYNLVVRRYTHDLAGVKACIADNGLNSKDNKDVVYAMIIVNLVQFEAIIITDDRDPICPDATDCPYLDLARVHSWAEAAERMVTLTIYLLPSIAQTIKRISRFGREVNEQRAAKGTAAAESTCYKHFCKVCGNLVSQRRFGDLWRMIVSSKGLRVLAKALTVGKIRAEDEDLQHCLIWSTTPEMVIKGLKPACLLPEIKFLMDYGMLQSYASFCKAGIVAQVTSGPLKAFCKGKVDPMRVFPIPDHIRICDLAPGDSPPEDLKLIRQAKMVMQVFGIEYGKWHEGIEYIDSDYVFWRLLDRAHRMEMLHTPPDQRWRLKF